MSVKSARATLLLVSSLLGSTWLLAQDSTNEGAPVPSDNLKLNQRDQNGHEPTADRQRDSRSDRDITRQVRWSIVKDKSFSTDAHNVKIITQNGQGTLKGPVRSDDEKRAVEARAAEVAGQNNVTSDLDVKPKN